MSSDGSTGNAIVGAAFIIFLSGLFGWNCYNRNIRGNKRIIDTAYTYNYADVYLPNGEKKTYEISQWADYEGEQISIWTKDGRRLLLSSFNTILRDR